MPRSALWILGLALVALLAGGLFLLEESAPPAPSPRRGEVLEAPAPAPPPTRPAPAEATIASRSHAAPVVVGPGLQIFDADGQPLAQATVRLTADVPAGAPAQHLRSDPEGRIAWSKVRGLRAGARVRFDLEVPGQFAPPLWSPWPPDPAGLVLRATPTPDIRVVRLSELTPGAHHTLGLLGGGPGVPVAEDGTARLPVPVAATPQLAIVQGFGGTETASYRWQVALVLAPEADAAQPLPLPTRRAVRVHLRGAAGGTAWTVVDGLRQTATASAGTSEFNLLVPDSPRGRRSQVITVEEPGWPPREVAASASGLRLPLAGDAREDTGQVVDQAGRPVAGARVFHRAAETLSDREGRFQLPCGQGWIQATHPAVGFARQKAVSRPLLLVLSPGLPREGQVVDSDGQPAAGIEIRLEDSLAAAVSDAAGAFELRVPPSGLLTPTTWVGFRRPGQPEQEALVSPDGPIHLQLRDEAATATAGITLRLIHPEGWPLSSFRYTLMPRLLPEEQLSEHPPQLPEQGSDARGRLTIGAPWVPAPEGDLGIEAVLVEGPGCARQLIDVRGLNSGELEVQMRPGRRVFGRWPASALDLSACTARLGTRRHRDLSPAFRFDGVPTAVRHLDLLGPDGHLVLRVPIAADEGDAGPLEIPGPGHLVFEAEAVLPEGLEIHLQDLDDRLHQRTLRVVDGALPSLLLPVGRYSIAIGDPSPERRQAVTLAPNTDTVVRLSVPEPEPILHGVVALAETPLGGIELHLHRAEGALEDTRLATGRSDAQGQFDFGLFPPGRYRLVAHFEREGKRYVGKLTIEHLGDGSALRVNLLPRDG